MFYVPQLGFHLMSVSEVCKLGMRVIFDEYTVSIQDKATGKVVRGVQLRTESTSYMLCPLFRTLRLVICGIIDLAT